MRETLVRFETETFYFLSYADQTLLHVGVSHNQCSIFYRQLSGTPKFSCQGHANGVKFGFRGHLN